MCIRDRGVVDNGRYDIRIRVQLDALTSTAYTEYGISIGAVSYTHLDVYKRPGEGMGCVDDETDVVGHAEFEHGIAVHTPCLLYTSLVYWVSQAPLNSSRN